MQRFKQIFNSAMTALVCTLGIATISILVVMFTTRDSGVKRTGLFDSVFFESIDKGDGSLRLGVGINDILPLLIIWAFLTTVIFVSYTFYKLLSRYKENLKSLHHDP